MAKHIVVIPGDGIGEEITASAVRVLQKIDEVCHIFVCLMLIVV